MVNWPETAPDVRDTPRHPSGFRGQAGVTYGKFLSTNPNSGPAMVNVEHVNDAGVLAQNG